MTERRLPPGIFADGFDGKLAAEFLAELQGVEKMADFIAFVMTQILPRDHLSTFWGDRMLTIDKSAGFMTDPPFRSAFEAVRGSHVYDQYPSSDTIAWRLHTLVWAARQALQLPDGDFIECGVFKGDMAWVITQATDISRSGRRFFLFDSFDGFHPELTSEADFPDNPGFIAFANEFYKKPGLHASVVERFKPMDYVTVVQGFLPEAFESVRLPEKISFLHIDLNSAAAEVKCLEMLFDRMVDGGMIVFDDYGWRALRAQKEAEDAFFAARGYGVLELPTGQGLVVKRRGADHGFLSTFLRSLTR